MVFGMEVINTTDSALGSTSNNKGMVEDWNAFQQPTNLLPDLVLPPKKRRWIVPEPELAVKEYFISQKCLPPKKRCTLMVEFEPEPRSQILPEPEENQNRINDEVNHQEIIVIENFDTEVLQENECINNDEKEVGKVEGIGQSSNDETEAIMLTVNASSTQNINADYVLEEENKNLEGEFSKSGESDEIMNINSNKMLVRKPRTKIVVKRSIENTSEKKVITKQRSNLERKPRNNITLKFEEGFKEKEENHHIQHNDLYSIVKSRSRNKMAVEQSSVRTNESTGNAHANTETVLATGVLTDVANGASGAHGGRCTRSNGKGWRCNNVAKSGHSLCDHHLFLGSRGKINARQQRIMLQDRPMRYGSLIDIYERTKEVPLDWFY